MFETWVVRAYEIKDEPGAEERFDRILGRVLTTPPKRVAKKKPHSVRKTKPSEGNS